MRFVEYTERSVDSTNIGDCEVVYVSRLTGEIVAKSQLSDTTKSHIMDMYDDNRVFISGVEYEFRGRDFVAVEVSGDCNL